MQVTLSAGEGRGSEHISEIICREEGSAAQRLSLCSLAADLACDPSSQTH